MGRRVCAHAVVQAPAPSLPSPNATVPGITVDLRIFWPPGTPEVDILGALEDAYTRAAVRVEELTAGDEVSP